jgi:hypothetical protein
MSDQKPTIQVDAILPETIIPIKVSGGYYMSLQQMFMNLAMERPEKEFKEVMQRLKENERPRDAYEFHLHTLLSLIFEIENEAKRQGLTTKKDVDPDKIPKLS